MPQRHAGQGASASTPAKAKSEKLSIYLWPGAPEEAAILTRFTELSASAAGRGRGAGQDFVRQCLILGYRALQGGEQIAQVQAPVQIAPPPAAPAIPAPSKPISITEPPTDLDDVFDRVHRKNDARAEPKPIEQGVSAMDELDGLI